MALTFLVDTSVLKRLGRASVREVIEPLAVAGQLARATISDLEVGYSAPGAHEWDDLVGALDAMYRVETSVTHERRALQVQQLLAQANQRGRKVPDLLIAAAAEEGDLIVLHYDADFDRIATVTGQRTHWVVPAGSVEQVACVSRIPVADPVAVNGPSGSSDSPMRTSGAGPTST